MNIETLFAEHFSESIQLTAHQAEVISSCMLARGSKCKALVFGLGNDTALWLAACSQGKVMFLESSDSWTEKIIERVGKIDVLHMPRYGMSVENSMDMTKQDLAQHPPPRQVRSTQWNVILVDGPPGHKKEDPGRALSIYWASVLATEDTHIFVHDYQRKLETHFTNALIETSRSNPSTVIPASKRHQRRQLYWSIGSLPTVRR